MPQMTISQWKQIRQELGLTQLELANELGMDRASITRYENGAVKIPESRARALELLAQSKER